MTEIFDFAKHATPTVLIALCLVIIIMILMDSNKSIFNIFKKQKLNTYKIEGSKTSLDSIAKQLETISTNHLHELPEMNRNISSIRETVNQIQRKQNMDSERIAKIEGVLKINI